MKVETFTPANAMQPIGPYSHVARAGSFIAISGTADLEHVLHVNVFLENAADFAEMNRAYSEVFGDHRPARTAVTVSDLPKKGALLTMNLTAVTKG